MAPRGYSPRVKQQSPPPDLDTSRCYLKLFLCMDSYKLAKNWFTKLLPSILKNARV